MRKDHDNELKAMGRLLVFAVCIAAMGGMMLGFRGCVNSGSNWAAKAPNAPQVSGFESFQGSVVLVEFAVSANGSGSSDSMLMNEWARQNTIFGLKYARVLSTVTDQAAPAQITLISDAAGKLASTCQVKARPWYVLLDNNGRVRYSSSALSPEIMYEWVAALQAERASATDTVAMFGVDPDGRVLRESTVLKSLDTGGNVRVSSLGGDAGTILLAVDTSCPYSEQAVNEFPEITPLLSSMGFGIAVVNINDPREAVEEYYSTHAAGLNVLYDEGSMTKLTWNIETIPTVFVLDESGEIHYASSALWADVINAASAVSQSKAASEYNVKVRGTGYG